MSRHNFEKALKDIVCDLPDSKTLHFNQEQAIIWANHEIGRLKRLCESLFVELKAEQDAEDCSLAEFKRENILGFADYDEEAAKPYWDTFDV